VPGTICRGMANIHLTADEASVLTRELTNITEGERCSQSPRIQTLKAILAKLERRKKFTPWPFLRGAPCWNDQVKLSATALNTLAVASFRYWLSGPDVPSPFETGGSSFLARRIHRICVSCHGPSILKSNGIATS